MHMVRVGRDLTSDPEVVARNRCGSSDAMHHSMHAARYLIFFQYIGTKYSGVARSPQGHLKKGVQNYIEDAVRHMKPANQVSLYVSSRTDSGVHALSNSAHFDLQRRDDRPPLSEDELLAALNYHLRSEEIRITRVQRVPAHFHAQRRAQSRTYVYRLAQADSLHGQLPLTEDRLCWAPPPRSAQLDVEAMREAAALLVGKHDFSTFRAVNKDMPFKSPIKTLSVAHIAPGKTFAQTHFHSDIRFWELTFKGRSFLYKQVRRMTGALVAVGQGQLSMAQLRALLEARDTLAYPADLLAPPWGLFLTRVDYNQSDLQFPEEGEEGSLPPHGNPED